CASRLSLPNLSVPSSAAAAATTSAASFTRSPMQPFQGNALFSSFDDPLLQARAAQALENIDVKNVIPMRPDAMFNYSNYLMSSQAGQDPHNLYQGIPSSSSGGADNVFDPSLLVPTSSDQSIGGDSMTSLQQVMAMHAPHYPSHPFQPFQYPMPVPSFASVSSSVGGDFKSGNSSSSAARYPLSAVPTEVDTDPRELERFAEHFKQRRIKLGVTQADVGKALAHLRMPGVGSLSQSTICRFESLTLSHNNMVALKPILHSWLEKAEEAVKNKDIQGDLSGILPNTDKKRKRTSIAAPEKRLLEDYFRQQPRPSGERIAAIADKLDLKKNVVRVWFCNQRQKQKRSALSQFRSNCRTVMPSVVAGLSSSISNPTVSSTSSSAAAAAARNVSSSSVAASVAAAAGLPAFAAIGNGTYFD
ncbi:hypothetical protein PMAYCL1PPCAC_13290, partial [Pristionchus mayeri]